MKKLIIVPARHNKAAPCFFGESIRRYGTGSYIYKALKGGQVAAVGSGILVKEEAVALVVAADRSVGSHCLVTVLASVVLYFGRNVEYNLYCLADMHNNRAILPNPASTDTVNSHKA